MTVIYTIMHDDRDYEDGYDYSLGSFAERQQAEFLLNKLNTICNTIVERADKFCEKHENFYLKSVQERMFDYLKRSPKYSYLRELNWSSWFPIAPRLRIHEQMLYNDFHDYKRSLLDAR